MRAVVQRVSRASVRVAGEVVGTIGLGFLVLAGVEQGDTDADVEYVAEKVSGLRVFEDPGGKMNLSLADVSGAVLLVSQFTLHGDCRKGRRPSFTTSAPPELAERLYLSLAERLRARGVPVATGRFREEMQVELTNEGPVTLLLDSRRGF
ncbi:MAG: D-tyrosyl-tRNA(Tyr) deacylase [Deltaproteobacteria bacterium]|nr:D-tyrosyl-tRNA(Tyr) deacylase [Deltaproteobacteria bacterium]